MSHCLVENGQIVRRGILWDGESRVILPEGAQLLTEAECAGLPDAPPPTPRNAHQVQPEGFWISKARDAQNDYANLTTMYQNLSGLGSLAAESTVQLETLDGVKTVTWLRYQQIMAAYGMALAAEIFGGSHSDQ